MTDRIYGYASAEPNIRIFGAVSAAEYQAFASVLVRSERGDLSTNCAFRDKSMKLAGDMSFYVLFHIRVGATLGHDADPPFWGVKAPPFLVFLIL